MPTQASQPEIYDANLVVGGKRHPAGRMMVRDGSLHHLSDYHGLLQSRVPSGPVDEVTMARLKNPGKDLEVASHSDIRNGRYLHGIPEAELQPLPEHLVPQPTAQPLSAVRPPAVFLYHRVGMAQPHVIEFAGGQAVLDGHPLTPSESSLVLRNAATGVASLRYRHRQVPQAVAKAEQAFRDLVKADELEPGEAMAHVDDLVGRGEFDPKVAKALRRHIYEDRMVPGIGNKLAWEEHRAKNMPGVYGSLDLNDFKAVNDVHGHDAGDAAIRAFGRAAREALDESGGSQHVKLFRPGGDEFAFHAAAPQHAYAFLRDLRSKLAQVPPVNGVHQISMSAGLGQDFPSADAALLEAKKQKLHPGTTSRKYAPGEVPNLAHSNLPGAEGPVPVDASQLPLARLPEGAKVKLPEEPKAQLQAEPQVPVNPAR